MPLADSGAAAPASIGRPVFAITSPWPGSLMFQPNSPSWKRANSIAFETGSSAPIRFDRGRDLLDLVEGLLGDDRLGAEQVDGHVLVLLEQRRGSAPAPRRAARTAPGPPERAAQAAAGIA